MSQNSLDVHFLSLSDEWLTPDAVIELTLKLFSEIDLDPCAEAGEVPNVPAHRHFTKEDDGLLKSWSGKVYMNPPYGRAIGAWVEKLVYEFSIGNVTEAIALVPARTETRWFSKLRDFPCCFVRGRLKFKGSRSSAPFPSAIFYLGPNLRSFIDTFLELGDVYFRIDSRVGKERRNAG